MTALVIQLKTSQGVDVTLRVGRDIGWPDGARMDWVRNAYDVPAHVVATLDLIWHERDGGGIEMECRVEDSTPWEGFQASDAGDQLIFSACEDSFAEWVDSFCANVNKALADTAALTPFADLHYHEVEAMRAWRRLGHDSRAGRGTILQDGKGTPTAAEASLAQHVFGVIIETAERESQRTAAAQYKEMGGRHEEGTDREAGLGPRSVPIEVLEQAAREMRTQHIMQRWGPTLSALAPHDVAGHVCDEECIKPKETKR